MIEDVLMSMAVEAPVAVVAIYGLKRFADALIKALATVESIALQQSQASADIGQEAMRQVSLTP